ncbi:MAG: (Fe-S)-binding protein [Planctomycetes bacterium]|nr:(Fe-S)-binding protein [Planctomycetota bacterium]
MHTALFITCLADQLRPSIGVATVRILRRLGLKPEFPAAQGCCGQPAWNLGHVNEAKVEAQRMLNVFRDYDAVVTPSGSCAAMVQHYSTVFGKDDALTQEAHILAAKTYELSAFIVNRLGVKNLPGCFPHRVTWHASCHGTRLADVRSEPLQLLSGLEGLELVPLPRAEDCCGFGGAFCVKFPEVSAAMGREKCSHVSSTRANVLAGNDAGCLLHLQGLLSRDGTPTRVLHLAELLEEAATGRAAC